MAAYNGTQCALIAAGSEPDVTEVGARVRCFTETFTYAAQASGSTITVAKLPAGAMVLGFELNTSVTTGSATIAVGDGTNTYVAAAAYTTPGDTVLAALQAGNGMTSPLSADGSIILTTGAAALPASGTLLFKTYYVVD